MRRPLDDLQDAKEQAIPREAPGEGSRRTPGREDGKKGEAPPPRAARLGESEEDIPEVYVACEVRSALPGTPLLHFPSRHPVHPTRRGLVRRWRRAFRYHDRRLQGAKNAAYEYTKGEA